VPWARRAGARCADLVCLEYEKELDADLIELRMRWRIDVAPKQE
jgi:ubiquinone biosynthesis protein COQ4